MEPPRKFNPHPFAYHQELDVRIDNLTNGVPVSPVSMAGSFSFRSRSPVNW